VIVAGGYRKYTYTTSGSITFAPISTFGPNIIVNSVKTFDKPGAPTITNWTIASRTANISYSAPSYNGNSNITSYTLVSVPENRTVTISQATSGNISMTGLSEGTTYVFSIYATNSVGSSSPSIPTPYLYVPVVVPLGYLVQGAGGGTNGGVGGNAGQYNAGENLTIGRGTSVPITVGIAGTNSATYTAGGPGSPSTFGSYVISGGGAGCSAFGPGGPPVGGSGAGGPFVLAGNPSLLGGPGIFNDITGTNYEYGIGGQGYGPAGSYSPPAAPGSGTYGRGANGPGAPGTGSGNGIVVLRHPNQYSPATFTSGSSTLVGSNVVYTFTSPSTITF
jgi:hypothetical protein